MFHFFSKSACLHWLLDLTQFENRLRGIRALSATAEQVKRGYSGIDDLREVYNEFVTKVLDLRELVESDVYPDGPTADPEKFLMFAIKRHLMTRARIYFSTLNVSMSTDGNYPYSELLVDVAIVDEAAQVLPSVLLFNDAL